MQSTDILLNNICLVADAISEIHKFICFSFLACKLNLTFFDDNLKIFFPIYLKTLPIFSFMHF